MPNSIVEFGGTRLRRSMECMLPFFGPKLDLTNPYWWCTELFETKGALADEATVVIPCSSISESAWAGVLNPDGPYAYLKQGMFCAIRKKWFNSDEEAQYDLKMVGVVDEIAHDVESMALIVKVQSVKNKLRDIRLIGSWWWDGGRIVHRSGFALNVNPGGRPNCIWVQGRIPCVCLPDFGIGDDEEPAGPFERSATKATYWTLNALLLNAYYFHGPDAIDPAIAGAWAIANLQTPGLKRCPSWLVWPNSFGADVDLEFVLNWNTGAGQNNSLRGGARKGRALQFANGVGLIGDTQGTPGFLDMAFAAAGGWDYHLEFIDSIFGEGKFYNVLMSVPTRWSANVGAKPMPYGTGQSALAFKSPCINGGAYVESSRELYNRVVGIGSKYKIELRVEWSDGVYGTDSGGGLIPRWDLDLFQLLRFRAVNLTGGTPTPTSFKDAMRENPDVLEKYLVHPLLNYYTGTGIGNDKADLPALALPFLLTFAGARDLSVANDIVHLPVRLEVSVPVSPDDPMTRQWVPLGDQTGFVTWENGVLQFEGLKQIGVEFGDTKPGLFSWYPVADPTPVRGIQYQVDGGLLNIAANPVRMTIALAADSALIRAWQSMGGEIDSSSLFQRETDSPDAEKMDPSFERTAVLDLAGLYELWTRVNSFPIPESSGGVQYPNKTFTDPLRDDRELMDGHIIKGLHERHRLDRSKSNLTMAGWLADSWPVGTQVDKFYPVDPETGNKPFIARAIVASRRYRCTKIGEGEAATFENSTEHGMI